jgi:hypothetical protein
MQSLLQLCICVFACACRHMPHKHCICRKICGYALHICALDICASVGFVFVNVDSDSDYVRIKACIHVCVCVCAYAYTCIHAYLYAYISGRPAQTPEYIKSTQTHRYICIYIGIYNIHTYIHTHGMGPIPTVHVPLSDDVLEVRKTHAPTHTRTHCRQSSSSVGERDNGRQTQGTYTHTHIHTHTHTHAYTHAHNRWISSSARMR